MKKLFVCIIVLSLFFTFEIQAQEATEDPQTQNDNTELSGDEATEDPQTQNDNTESSGEEATKDPQIQNDSTESSGEETTEDTKDQNDNTESNTQEENENSSKQDNSTSSNLQEEHTESNKQGEVTDSNTEKNESQKSVDEWIELADSKRTASGMLASYIEAYKQYPENDQIIEGVHRSAKLLLNWATGQHQEGDIETARNRYDTILEAPVLSEEIEKETTKKLEYAKAQETLPTIQDFKKQADTLRKASLLVELYEEAQQIYPNNTDIIERLEDSASSLFEWAKSQQEATEYKTAVNRYERILGITSVSDELKKKVNHHLNYASQDQRTPDQQYNLAKNSRTASRMLELYTTGYGLYSEDDRFEEGVIQASRNLLNWATGQHQEGDIETARNRYETILEAPVLSEEIEIETTKKLEYAKAQETLPTIQDFKKQADTLRKASSLVELYEEAQQIYPNNTDIIERLEDSASSLFEWAKSQQEATEYKTAVNRYERILGITSVSNELKDKVNHHLNYASQDQRTPDQQYNLAKNSKTASRMLELYSTGYELYSEDDRFEEGVIQASRNLLNWATGQHQEGDIETARNRYETILDAPVLSEETEKETTKKLEYAQNGEILPTVQDFEKDFNDTNIASQQLEIAIEAYVLYPKSEVVNQILETSQSNLLDWATDQHQEGKIETARNRYEKVLDSPIVSELVKSEAENKLEYAKDNQKLPEEKYFISLIENSGIASEHLEIANEGYTLYPESKRLQEVLQDSQITLLDWATSQHQSGRIEVAKKRYEKVIKSYTVSSKIKAEAEFKLQLSEQGKVIDSVSDTITKVENSVKASTRLNYLENGIKIHPRNEEIKRLMNSNAKNLYAWAQEKHQTGQFDTAINRYNKILNLKHVNNSLKEEVRDKLSLAENSDRIHPIGDIINSSGEYSYSEMANDITLLENTYPDLVKTEIIGQSVDRRNLYAVKLGHGDKEIFLNGSHHAREHMTTNVLMEMMDVYAESYELNQNVDGYDVRGLLNNVSIWFVPMVNPDGVMLVQEGAYSASNPSKVIELNNGSRDFTSWKANVRGVDLNRQYPAGWENIRDNSGTPSSERYKGYKPLSEPETKALADFTNSHDFMTTVAYHSSGEIIYWHYNNPSSTFYRDEQIASNVGTITGYEPVDPTPNPSGGGYKDWFVEDKNLPGMTIEISPYTYGEPVPLSYWPSIWNENRSVGLYLAKEALNR
ncbi:M14 family zinc carboxypeptidase [Alkalibacillus almallahensis]|uniref:M14 family zinc carboxypeptidase n=1 Tax=Alkalibacillus almallahensis TaxID=1379154 RepID=UPI00141E0476|nr:M14 family zinc carboxypeptidase [Alkalibacillus almallahensis]NIK11822.1 glutaredoxin 2 [Alkalibacillus almallahensis]